MPETPRIYRFGDYRLDLAGRELHLGAKPVQLSPLMFDCLAWLFDRRDRAVGRDELSAAVWGRVDITDTQIDQLIRKVRRAVGDTGSDQEVIRTIPRFGYRWVAEVDLWQPPVAEVVEGRSIDEQASPSEPPPRTPSAAESAVADEDESRAHVPTTPRPRRSWRIGALALVVLVGLAGLAFHHFGAIPTPAPVHEVGSATAEAEAPPRLIQGFAVLPVAIDGAVDSESAWLRLGLMELIAVRLREGGLTVVPTSNILALTRDGEPEPPKPEVVQAATGIEVVVSPSLRKTSNGWRLQLELLGADQVAKEVQTHADDAVASARLAADRLLVLLGKTPRSTEEAVLPGKPEMTLYRVDAAIDGGNFEMARQLLDDAPPAMRADSAFRLRRARVELAGGNQTEANELFQSVLDSHGRTPLRPSVQVEALIGTAILLAQNGHIDTGRARLDTAIELARKEHLTLSYADAMASRATLNAAMGAETEADSDFGQARVALELAGDTLGLAELEANHAATLTQRYRYAEASLLLDKAIARMQRFPPGETLVTAVGNRIFMHLAMLEPREALKVADEAKGTIARVGNLMKRQAFTLHRARALMANGRLSEARQLLEQVGAEVDSGQAPQLQVRVLGGMAQLAYVEERWRDAADLSERQLALLATPALSMPLYERTHSVAWLTRIRALRRIGSSAEAKAELARFSTWAKTQSSPGFASQLALAEAEQAAAEHRQEAAVAGFETAMREVKRGAAPADVVRVAVSYGDYLIENADPEAATRVVGQVAQWVEQDFDCALLQVRLYHSLGQHKAWEAALANARDLAGERVIPADLQQSGARIPSSTGTIGRLPGG